MAGGYESGTCTKAACHADGLVNKPFSLSYKSSIQEARSDHYLLSIFQKVRPNIAGLVAETNGFMLSQGYKAKWSPVYRELTTEKGSKKDMVHIHIDNQPTSLQTTNIASPFPSLFKGNISSTYILLLGALLAIFLYLTYLLVNYILKTYFSWNIFTLSKALALSDDEYIKINPCLKNKSTFLITSSSPRKVCLTGFETINLTLIDRPEAEHDIQKRLNSIKNKANVLLENFSYNPKSIEAWNKKLMLLEELVHIDDAQIAIQSHIRPLQIFEVYEKEIQRAEHEVRKHQKSDAPNQQTVAD